MKYSTFEICLLTKKWRNSSNVFDQFHYIWLFSIQGQPNSLSSRVTLSWSPINREPCSLFHSIVDFTNPINHPAMVLLRWRWSKRGYPHIWKIYTFSVPLLQISINSFVSYSNISRSMEKCCLRRTRIEQETSLKKSSLCFGEGPPFVWWIHFASSSDETNWFNPLWYRTCASSSSASSLITASYGIRQGAHCRLQNKWKIGRIFSSHCLVLIVF